MNADLAALRDTRRRRRVDVVGPTADPHVHHTPATPGGVSVVAEQHEIPSAVKT
jgi:hypothetical protein